MQPSDRTEFLRVLNGLAAIKGKDLTAEALDLWWAAMSRWSISDFKAAASHLVSACQFMPTPYDFDRLRRIDQPTAGEAWALVLEATKPWKNAEDRPGGRIGRAVAAVGGYRAISMANIERDLPHLGRRFKEVYEELSDAEETREALEDFGMRKLPAKVQGGATVDEALRPLLLEDEGSGKGGRRGFTPIV